MEGLWKFGLNDPFSVKSSVESSVGAWKMLKSSEDGGLACEISEGRLKTLIRAMF